jgi:transcriptional regulator with XRE-family HTH domain
MKSAKTRNDRSEAIRRRLMTVRTKETGDNRSAFARKLGLSVNRWNNYEHGYPVPLSVIIDIINLPTGYTAGYLIDGDRGSLIKRLADELDGLGARPDRHRGRSFFAE